MLQHFCLVLKGYSQYYDFRCPARSLIFGPRNFQQAGRDSGSGHDPFSEFGSCVGSTLRVARS
jgi:hypothetical protein